MSKHIALICLLILGCQNHFCWGQTEEGSGDEAYDDLDDVDDDDSYRSVIVPSRVIPELQTPAPSLPESGYVSPPNTVIAREDPIFVSFAKH